MRPPARINRETNKEYKSKIIATLLILFIVKNKATQQMCKKILYRQLIRRNLTYGRFDDTINSVYS